VIDFAALPPEINSARMYSGPGSAPMLAAAAAWNTMAAEMRTAAACYGSVVSELAGESWLGPSSMSMSAAAAPYLGWLSTTATQAEQAGTQAMAAVNAYEFAFAMTVPPAVVAANRAELGLLVATNVFGQNTPAIAATEAQYAEMWAQDATAMNGYASASDIASELTPLSAPQSTTNPNGAADQANAVAQAVETPTGSAQSILSSAAFGDPRGILGWLESLLAAGSDPSSPLSGLASLLSGSDNSALGTFLSSNLLSTGLVNGSLAGGPFNPQFLLQSVAGFSFLFPKPAALSGSLAGDVFASPAGALGSGGLPGLGAIGSAGMGHANLVGALSVPPSWAPAATINPAPTSVPATGLSDIGASSAGGPGGFAAPMGAAARRLRRAIPKYGFRPVVMPRPPAAG
jgi:PPE-repeat protein